MKKTIHYIRLSLIFTLTFLLHSLQANAQSPESFTSPGTYDWTVPPCVTSITVKVWGAGGGGGGAIAILRNSSDPEACAGAGGGGGGGYTSQTFTVTPGQTYTITVGAGGTGGAGGAGTWNGGITTQPTQGGTGGTSSFIGIGANLNATGGTGGMPAGAYNNNNPNDVNDIGAGGNGGVGSGGTSNYLGGNGAAGHILNLSTDKSGGGGGAAGPGGNGGNATAGNAVGTSQPPGGIGQAPGGDGAAGGLHNIPSNKSVNGGNGSNYGGAGSGGLVHRENYGVQTATGGSGANGAVIIEYTTDGTTPPTPTISTTAATCNEAGVSTITNYDPSNTYVFNPSGPTVGAGGVINNMTAGTNYTVIASPNGGGCDSPSSNTFSNDPKLDGPIAPDASDQSFCDPATIADLQPSSGTGINWYSSATGGTALTSTTGLTDGTTYYVSQTSGGCESTRKPVTVTIFPKPTVFAGNDTTINCNTSVQIGETPPTTPEPEQPMAPSDCPAASNMIVNPAGGAYINSVTTTGGVSTNINNTNTLVDGDNPQTTFIAHNRWYSNYTNHVVDAYQGGTFNLNLSGHHGATGSNPPTYSFRIWIDWNNDGTFDNVVGSELVHTTPVSGTNPFNFNNIPINVPANAQVGTVRMRVRVKYGAPFVASDEACTKSNPNGWEGQGNYDHTSEVEDYAVKILASNSTGGSTGNTGNVTYTWTPADDLDDPTVPNPTATPTTTTTYTVTITDENGCQASDQVTVTVNSNTVPQFTNPGPICEGTTFTLPTTSDNGIIGSWDKVEDNTQTTSYTFTPANNQCAVDTTIQVIVNPIPDTPLVTSTGATCDDAGFSTLDNYDATNTYTFSPTGPTIGANNEINGMTFGTTYTVTAEKDGCPSATSAPFSNDDKLDPSSSPTVTTTPATCLAPGSSTLNNYNANNTYVFTPTGPTVGANGVINNMTIGESYTVKIDNGSCASGDSAPFSNDDKLDEPDQPTISVSNATCGEAGIASITNYDVNSTYIFTPTGPTVNANGDIENVTFGQNYTVEADNGCLSPASASFSVSDKLPSPVLTISPDATICLGDSATIIATGATSYSWDNNLGNNNNAHIVSPTSTTTYTVTGKNNEGCEDTKSVTITILDVNNVSITVDTTSGCSPLEVKFSGAANGATEFLWDFGDGTTSNLQNPTHTYTEDSCYTVTLTADNGMGCPATVTLPEQICVFPNPVADFTASTNEITPYNTEVKFVNNSLGATSYTWDFGDDIGISKQVNPTYTYDPEETTNYTVILTAKNEYGCTDTAKVVIKMIDDIVFFVPNTFTPDGDEFNNTFKPIFADGQDDFDYELLIFDRWGEIIFESRNTQFGWDGTYLGRICSDGTYVWRIIIKKKNTVEKIQKSGHITLLK